MPRARKKDSADPVPGDTASLADLGLRGHVVSRRTAIKAGLGVAAGAGLAATVGAVSTSPAHAGLNKLAQANASRVGGTYDRPLGSQFTGQNQTGKYGVFFTDLCIPVQRADGSLLFIGGDTYGYDGSSNPINANNDWRAPVGLTSTQTNSDGRVVINGAITDSPGHAKALVIQEHANNKTTLPTDVFRVGNNLYMNIVRGQYGGVVQDSLFFRSTDGGNNWTYLRGWPPALYSSQFQQKTYAVADDAYVYCMTTVFKRETPSGLLLFRVLKTDLDKTDAQCDASGFGAFYCYQGWGYANGRWAWGNQPTTILETRTWGEICFRAMGGKYALTWFQPNQQNKDLEDCRAMVFPLPTSNLITTTEQTMVYHSINNPSANGVYTSVQPFPYGPFILPDATFANFKFVVSDWNNAGSYGPESHNYCVSQWKTSLNPNI